MSAPMYNVFVGSETGLFKGVDISKNVWDNINSVDVVDREKEVCDMCWENESQNELLIGLRNKSVLSYDTVQGIYTGETSYDAGQGCLKNIAKFENGIITAVESGIVKQWKDNELQAEFNAGDNLQCMSQNPRSQNQVATGGEENELKLWDVNKNEGPIFQAKNVKNDWLNLRVPIWVSGIRFLQEHKIVTCTGHHQIRVYDPKSQRRPVLDISFDEYPISAISVCPKNENHVVIGNTRGSMALMDLRVGKMLHLFKGFAGGIRSIQCHSYLPLVASCGLDRFLRIHDLNSKTLLHKFYLKSRLNCLLFADNLDSNNTNKTKDDEKVPSATEEDVDDDESEDEMWNNMQVVKTKTKRKLEKDSDIAIFKKSRTNGKDKTKLKKSRS